MESEPAVDAYWNDAPYVPVSGVKEAYSFRIHEMPKWCALLRSACRRLCGGQDCLNPASVPYQCTGYHFHHKKVAPSNGRGWGPKRSQLRLQWHTRRSVKVLSTIHTFILWLTTGPPLFPSYSANDARESITRRSGNTQQPKSYGPTSQSPDSNPFPPADLPLHRGRGPILSQPKPSSQRIECFNSSDINHRLPNWPLHTRGVRNGAKLGYATIQPI